MSTIGSVSSNLAAYNVQAGYTKPASAKEAEKDTTKKKYDDAAAVYEKSPEASVREKSSKTNQALVAQLKADSDARIAQMQSLVEKTLSKQGQTLANSDDIWSFFRNGDFKNVDEAAIEQAKKDVAEDGYWGADKTSDRILDFAKALSGDDVSKADKLLEAFKKGFKEATKTWGGELPALCKDTYDMVEKKFDQWKNEEV